MRTFRIAYFLAAASVVLAAQTEPLLKSANLPQYPKLARQARIEGVVKVTFVLPANADVPKNVEAASGHPMLKDAAVENVRTWRFENPYAVDRKYETTFNYKLSGIEDPIPKRIKVTFDSFDRVEILSDLAAVNITNSN
jgi:TonB family protein